MQHAGVVPIAAMWCCHRHPTSVRHCPQPPSVLLWTPAPYRPLTRPLPRSTSLHYGSSWWLEIEGWPSQTILAANSGGWPATNEPRTGDVETAWSGQIDMAETHSNNNVYDKLLKKTDIDAWSAWLKSEDVSPTWRCMSG